MWGFYDEGKAEFCVLAGKIPAVGCSKGDFIRALVKSKFTFRMGGLVICQAGESGRSASKESLEEVKAFTRQLQVKHWKDVLAHKFPELRQAQELLSDPSIISAILRLHSLWPKSNSSTAVLASLLVPKIRGFSVNTDYQKKKHFLDLLDRLSILAARCKGYEQLLPFPINIAKVLERINFSSYNLSQDQDLRRIENQLFKDSLDFVSDYRRSLVNYGEVAKHSKLRGRTASSCNTEIAYRLPDVQFRSLLGTDPGDKKLNILAQFYLLSGKNCARLACFLHQALSNRSLPRCLNRYYGTVFTILTKLIRDESLQRTIEINAADTSQRILKISGQVKNYHYCFSVHLTSLPLTISLTRRAADKKRPQSEVLSLEKDGKVKWRRDLPSSHLDKVEKRQILSEFRTGNLETVLAAQLRTLSKHNITSVSEFWLSGAEQKITIEELGPNKFRLQLKLQDSRIVQQYLLVENGRIKSLVERVDGGSPTTVNLRAGYPFILHLIEAFRNALAAK